MVEEMREAEEVEVIIIHMDHKINRLIFKKCLLFLSFHDWLITDLIVYLIFGFSFSCVRCIIDCVVVHMCRCVCYIHLYVYRCSQVQQIFVFGKKILRKMKNVRNFQKFTRLPLGLEKNYLIIHNHTYTYYTYYIHTFTIHNTEQPNISTSLLFHLT